MNNKDIRSIIIDKKAKVISSCSEYTIVEMHHPVTKEILHVKLENH